MKRLAQFLITAILVFVFIPIPGAFADLGGDNIAVRIEPEVDVFKKCGDYQYAVRQIYEPPKDTLPIKSQLIIKNANGKILADETEEARITDDAENCILLSEKKELWGLTVQWWSGGAHCCFIDQIYQMTGALKSVFDFGAGNYDIWEIEDLDGDGVKEISMGDDRFPYFADLSFAESPGGPPMTFCYDGMEYRDCSFKFINRYGDLDTTFDRLKGEIEKERIDDSSESRPNGAVLYIIAKAYFKGEHEKWWRIFRRDLPKPILKWLESNRNEIEERMYARLLQSSKALGKNKERRKNFKKAPRKERSHLIKELSKTVRREHLAIPGGAGK